MKIVLLGLCLLVFSGCVGHSIRSEKEPVRMNQNIN